MDKQDTVAERLRGDGCDCVNLGPGATCLNCQAAEEIKGLREQEKYLRQSLKEAEAHKVEQAGRTIELMKEIKRLRSLYKEEYDIVDRVWKALGIYTYEQAEGLTIDQHVSYLRAELEYHLKQRNLWRGELPGVGKEWGTKPATQDQVDEIVGKSYF